MTEMEEGGWPRTGAMEMPAGGHSDVVENAEAALRSAVTALRNGSVRVLEAFWRTEVSKVLERIRPLGH